MKQKKECVREERKKCWQGEGTRGGGGGVRKSEKRHIEILRRETLLEGRQAVENEKGRIYMRGIT